MIDSSRTYLVVGKHGVGKSTVSNCILNINPHSYYIRNPCVASEKIQIHSNVDSKVIDTFGLGDVSLTNQTFVLSALRDGLASEENLIDLLVFVIKQEKIRVDTYDFFKLLQNGIFRGRARNNTVLICNGCEKGWLELNRAFSLALS